MKEIDLLFNDKKIVEKIQVKLPKLFHLAELESSRAGKIGMEVGTIREKIISALLLYVFGEENVKTDIPITEPEIDVILYGKPISIKTISGKNPIGIKLIWTVDAQKAIEFSQNYVPRCHLILVHINWNNIGGLYFISEETQLNTLKQLSHRRYIKLPKQGTNPRGVEMSAEAFYELTQNKMTNSISIDWIKEEIDYKPFDRWVNLWQAD